MALPDSALFPDPLAPVTPPPRSANWWRWGTVALVVAMVVGPIVAKLVPRELAGWQVALALEARLDGRHDEALERLEQAMSRYPTNAGLYLQRAQWRREDGRYEEALQDCNRAHELAEANPLVLLERSQVYQSLGRFADAVTDWKTLVELKSVRSALAEVSLWNGLAYARALAGTELEEALADAERAVQREPESAALLDTRGFVHLRRGQFEPALKDLDSAVKLAEARMAENSKKLDGLPSTLMDRRQADKVRKSWEHELAVILYHRSLALDALEQPEAAAADRDRVRQYGFTPGEELF